MENVGTYNSGLVIIWAIGFLAPVLSYIVMELSMGPKIKEIEVEKMAHKEVPTHIYQEKSKKRGTKSRKQKGVDLFSPPVEAPVEAEREETDISLIKDAAQLLFSLGHKKKEAEKLIQRVTKGKKFDNVEDIVTAAYAKS